jgi:hypothetical protein
MMTKSNRTQQYRLIDAEGMELAHGDTIEYFKGVVADFKTGVYTIQEVMADSMGHAHEVRRWGSITHLADGTIVLNEDRITN